MIKKKVCMVGDFAVGKTSLTQRIVNNCFSEKYLTTIGVKIDSIEVEQTKLIIWDIAGRDSLSAVNTTYLIGASGIVLVADGTRPSTIDALDSLWDTVTQKVGSLPVVVAINKRDHADWKITDEQKQNMTNRNWTVFETSAKDDQHVAELFAKLVYSMDD